MANTALQQQKQHDQNDTTSEYITSETTHQAFKTVKTVTRVNNNPTARDPINPKISPAQEY